jgi:hypothetical protein
VSTKKESCLPFYIVPSSHRIEERVSPYWSANYSDMPSCVS